MAWQQERHFLNIWNKLHWILAYTWGRLHWTDFLHFWQVWLDFQCTNTLAGLKNISDTTSTQGETSYIGRLLLLYCILSGQIGPTFVLQLYPSASQKDISDTTPTLGQARMYLIVVLYLAWTNWTIFLYCNYTPDKSEGHFGYCTYRRANKAVYYAVSRFDKLDQLLYSNFYTATYPSTSQKDISYTAN